LRTIRVTNAKDIKPPSSYQRTPEQGVIMQFYNRFSGETLSKKYIEWSKLIHHHGDIGIELPSFYLIDNILYCEASALNFLNERVPNKRYFLFSLDGEVLDCFVENHFDTEMLTQYEVSNLHSVGAAKIRFTDDYIYIRRNISKRKAPYQSEKYWGYKIYLAKYKRTGIQSAARE
jgi:hypothetical protein